MHGTLPDLVLLSIGQKVGVSGNTRQALQMAQIVLTKEPKVKSTAVNEIREKMRELIKRKGNQN